MTSWQQQTLEVHSRLENREKSGPVLPPIDQSSAVEHETARDLADVFSQRQYGFLYSRISNPSVIALEEKLTILEQGLGTVAVASGMAAVNAALLPIVQQGDHIVSGNSLYGGTFELFKRVFPRFGVNTDFVDMTDLNAVRAALRAETKVLFVEALGNPKLDFPDLKALAAVAHEHGCPLMVDATVFPPALLQCRKWGADIVIHSTSKYIDGHSHAIGGAVVDLGTFRFQDKQKFPDFQEFEQRYRQLAFLAKARKQIFVNMGFCLAPQNAFLQFTGLETLSLRMRQHSQNALALAQFLESHPKVRKVTYLGSNSHPQHELARKQLEHEQFGGLLTFELKDRDQVESFINHRSMARNLANIGDTRTLVLHPASTIYWDHSSQEQELLGVNERLVRVSVGIEHTEDVLKEFDQALEQC